jgi:hypothetical protein
MCLQYANVSILLLLPPSNVKLRPATSKIYAKRYNFCVYKEFWRPFTTGIPSSRDQKTRQRKANKTIQRIYGFAETGRNNLILKADHHDDHVHGDHHDHHTGDNVKDLSHIRTY